MHPKPGGVNTERVYDSSRDYTEYTEVPANNMAWLLIEVETFKNILKQFYDKFHTSRGVHWLDCTFDIDARNGYRDSRNVIKKLFQNLTSMPLRILRFLREHH